MTTTRGRVVTVVAVLVAIAAGALTWALLSGQERSTSASCSSLASRLTAEAEDDGTEVSFELQDTAPDQPWTVTVRHGDGVVYDGEVRTDEDGELDVDVFTPDSDPDDAFSVEAENADGVTCSPSLVG